MSDTRELAIDLVARNSVTPEDAGCQALLAERLAAIGFRIEHLRFDDVDNLWARRGSDGPLFAFAGHTDVVPPGPRDAWTSDPFTPEIRDGYLGHIHIKDVKVDTPRATLEVRRMGEGQLAELFQPLADALRADKYDGVISYESVYRPDGGDFEDGFRQCIGRFKEHFA